MAVLKLSQIAPAGASPALTDQVVGVTAGTTDNLFTVSQLGGYITAPGNLNFYVATTGSDSNPGTIGAPFATIQHAANIASRFDYQGVYAPTINVAAGTYTITQVVTLPELRNSNSLTTNAQGANLIGAGVGSTTISALTSFDGVFSTSGSLSSWLVDGFLLDIGGGLGVGAANGGQMFLGNITFEDSIANGFGVLFGVSTAGASLYGGGGAGNKTITFSSSIGIFAIVNNQAYANFEQITLVCPGAAFSVNNCWFLVNDHSFCISTIVGGGGGTITNFANGGTSGGIKLFDSGHLWTTNGLLSDWNGIAGEMDNSCAILNFNTFPFAANAMLSRFDGPPAASQISSSSFSIWMDQTVSKGGVFLAAQDKAGNHKLSQVGQNINTQTANYTLTRADIDGTVEMNLVGANTVTVPTNALQDIPVGSQIRIVQLGAGATTIAAAGGVTVHGAGALAAQYACAKVVKRATDEWYQFNGAY